MPKITKAMQERFGELVCAMGEDNRTCDLPAIKKEWRELEKKAGRRVTENDGMKWLIDRAMKPENQEQVWK